MEIDWAGENERDLKVVGYLDSDSYNIAMKAPVVTGHGGGAESPAVVALDKEPCEISRTHSGILLHNCEGLDEVKVLLLGVDDIAFTPMVRTSLGIENIVAQAAFAKNTFELRLCDTVPEHVPEAQKYVKRRKRRPFWVEQRNIAGCEESIAD